MSPPEAKAISERSGAMAGSVKRGRGAVGGGLDRRSIGIGMIPRGEVGLIFASIGTTLTIAGRPVINQAVFSAVVIMVVVTTLVTPPALAWSLRRGARMPSAAPGN